MAEERFVPILNDHLRRLASAISKDERKQILDSLTRAMISADQTATVLDRFMQEQTRGQRLALEILRRHPTPLKTSWVERVLPALSNRGLSPVLRVQAATAMLQSLPAFTTLSNQVLQSLFLKTKPERSLQRLKKLQERVGPYPSLDQLCEELQTSLAATCPKCGVRLSKEELIAHVWSVHRLVLEGNQARDPWWTIHRWLQEARGNQRQELLDRSIELALRIDPVHGLSQLHKLVLRANDIKDPNELLLTSADEQGAGICPNCSALVASVKERSIPVLNVSRSILSSAGYRVELSDGCLHNHLLIQSPTTTFLKDTDPRHPYSKRGQVLLLVTPGVLLMWVLVWWMPVWMNPAIFVFLLALLTAVLVFRIRYLADPDEYRKNRLIDYAWLLLAKRLHRPEASQNDALFLSSLAAGSINKGTPDDRERILIDLIETTTEAVRRNELRIEHLTELRRLQYEDVRNQNRDALPFLAEYLASCLFGEVPLRHAEQLLKYYPITEMARGERARLRVLILLRAFDVGWEVLDLQQAGRLCPMLGQVYASEDVKGMARLRFLYRVKNLRPWKKVGEAQHVFELARNPELGSKYLEQRPDLLLVQEVNIGLSDQENIVPILICEEGVVIREELIPDIQTSVLARPRVLSQGGGYEILIGGVRKIPFDDPPYFLAVKVQTWIRFLEIDFLDLVRQIAKKRSPKLLDQLLRQQMTTCPECQGTFLCIRGEMGVPVEQAG